MGKGSGPRKYRLIQETIDQTDDVIKEIEHEIVVENKEEALEKGRQEAEELRGQLEAAEARQIEPPSGGGAGSSGAADAGGGGSTKRNKFASNDRLRRRGRGNEYRGATTTRRHTGKDRRAEHLE